MDLYERHLLMLHEELSAGRDPCALCEGADTNSSSPLQRLLAPGVSRFIALTPRLVAVPTFGCFTAGYVLILPRTHVTSFGLLDAATLAEADELIASLTTRMTRVYGRRALGFEYGNNVPGGRRVEHAHWHLLPSGADLNGWLGCHLSGRPISSFTELPGSPDASYIAVRAQSGGLSVYPVPNTPRQRIRLRRLVAQLDPQVDAEGWDWAARNHPELIRRTVADLGPAPAVEG
jgi:diadenosine tetraphosphate (Ap4A) HIT family hydrolase